jgi:hypothetical protein
MASTFRPPRRVTAGVDRVELVISFSLGQGGDDCPENGSPQGVARTEGEPDRRTRHLPANLFPAR